MRQSVSTRLRPLALSEPRKNIPANDNNPDRVTRSVFHNGGCSTTSGRVYGSLPRIRCIDGAAA